MHRLPAFRTLVLLALATALFFPFLLPLWEGFDEPFHYGYVQWLRHQRQFPELKTAVLTAEVWRSIELTPSSEAVHQNLPETTSYDEWSKLPVAERVARREALASLNPALQYQLDFQRRNYEAHQPPLAYAVFAAIDHAVTRLPLPKRVLIQRLAASLLGGLLMGAAAWWLATVMEIPAQPACVALACLLQTQMLWATIAHIANDWLAVPIATAWFAAVLAANRSGRPRDLLSCCGLLAFGLLTKAYFLAFLPVHFGLVVFPTYRAGTVPARFRALAAGLAPLLMAVPWYWRNLTVAGSLSGTQESAAGIGLVQVIAALPQVHWSDAIATLGRGALWTGNNSFMTFSRNSLNLEWLLLLAGIGLALYKRRVSPWLWAGLASFIAALAYATASSWLYTHGVSVAASAWYAEVIIAPVFLIALAGFSAAAAPGRVLASLLLLLSSWIAVVSYAAKLVPLYLGNVSGRASLASTWKWWMRIYKSSDDPAAILSLGPPIVIYPLMFLVLGATLALVFQCVPPLWRDRAASAGSAHVESTD